MRKVQERRAQYRRQGFEPGLHHPTLHIGALRQANIHKAVRRPKWGLGSEAERLPFLAIPGPRILSEGRDTWLAHLSELIRDKNCHDKGKCFKNWNA